MKSHKMTVLWFVLSVLVIGTLGYFFIKTPFSVGSEPIIKETLPKDTHGYVVSDGKVFYGTGSGGLFEVTGVDIATFKKLDDFWAKDNVNIFFVGFKEIPVDSPVSIDPPTFTVITNILAKDRNVVYTITPDYETGGFALRVLPGADPTTFTIVNTQYAKDETAVYYMNTKGDGGGYGEVLRIDNIQGHSFKILGECMNANAGTQLAYYGTDGKVVSAVGRVLQEADAKTFKLIGTYTKDVSGDASGYFTSFIGSYATDKNHVYRDCGQIVQGVSPSRCTSNNLKGCEGK